jgi:Putative Ig domain
MSRLLQRFGGVFVLMALAVSAPAFSLIGPPGGGGDSYQTPNLSYGTPNCTGNGYVGAPKNLGEEYRWNIPTLYYACDATFLDYFGSNGLVAIDQAVSILSNSLSVKPVSGLSANLTEYPLESTRVNYQAQALQIFDIRSFTLSLLVEEMGLARADRWTWCLRDRTGTCGSYQYSVIQRNFDPIGWQPSAYVNGTLFTYLIVDFCPACDQADAYEVMVNPHDNRYSAVSSWDGLGFGTFFTGLTRDDMGGFRYLLSTNNMNVESVDPAAELIGGGFTNHAVINLLTSSNLAVFAQQLVTNSPSQMLGLYPGLQIATSGFVITNTIVTNILAGPTNLAGSSLAITNVSTNLLLTTGDLSLLAAQSLTNNSAALLALYPSLIITGEYPFFTNVVTTNVTAYFTNYPWSPAGSAPTLLYATNYTVAVATYYVHTFANVVTNQAFKGGFVTTVTTSVSSGQPWSQPGTLITNPPVVKTVFNTNLLTGDYYIVPPDLCAYSIIRTQLTVINITTNALLSATSTNGSTFAQSQLTYFTNHFLVAEPVTCVGFVTNLVPTLITNYSYAFDNIVTNVVSSNTTVTLLTTNIGPCPGGPVGAICTNITVTTNTLTNVLSGSFFIIPSNQCGLSIIGTQLVTVVATTNPLPSLTNSDGSTVLQSVVVYNTNYTVQVNPVNCAASGGSLTNSALRQGIDRMFFVRHDYDSLLSQTYTPVTNLFQLTAVQNNQATVQTFRRTIRRPDILFTADDKLKTVTSRTQSYYTNDSYANLAGPGTIRPQITISFNKVGPLRINQAPFFMDQISSSTNFIWGVFDATTNPPTIFPTNTDIVNLANQVLMQITNSANLTYSNSVPIVLGGTGGTKPYTWAISSDSPSGLPTSLSLSTAGVISGTVDAASAGTYDIRIQMTDAGQRSVTQEFSLIASP